jgi:hypothetical protein
MRLPRFRIRTLMIAVALVAVFLTAGLWWLHSRETGGMHIHDSYIIIWRFRPIRF